MLNIKIKKVFKSRINKDKRGARNFKKGYKAYIELRKDISKNAARPSPKGFMVKISFTIKYFRRKLLNLKQQTTRNFFWGRSKLSRYVVHTCLVLIIIALILTSFNSKPVSANLVPTSYNIESNIDNTLASVDDFSITTQAGATRIPDTRKSGTVAAYIVQQGDSIGSIADKFGITAQTIKDANSLKDDSITVGQSLKILPIPGILHTVQDGDTLDQLAQKYKIAESGLSTQSIVDWNSFLDDKLPIGTEIIIPGGKLPPPVVVAPPPVYVASVPQTPIYADTGEFIRPTSGGNVSISQCYTGYHDGVDIAMAFSSRATPTIVAARAGTVSFSGVMGGWTVIIKHADGYETVYYHMANAPLVGNGQKVETGQALGIMGCTGRCTGTHLHFTMRRNGVTINPLSKVNLRNAGDQVRC